MSSNGTGRKLLSLISVLALTALIVFLVYEHTNIFKKQTKTTGEESAGSAYKIDKSALIANLEKKIRLIPAENVAANLSGYRRLLKLAPDNLRYKKKVADYSARLKQTDGGGKRVGVKESIKIGYPSPRVLSAPETGEMIGRVESGRLVEILDMKTVSSSALKIVWYKINYSGRQGWISELGTSGAVIVEKAAPGASDRSAEAKGPSDPWEKLAARMINDYRGKIISIDRLDINESHFSLYSGMNPEQVRQTCENIGYYIRNSTGESPVVVAFIDRIPVAKAHPVGTKYQATLVTN